MTPLPFELHPEIPLEGRPLKPGRYARIAALAAEAGMPFREPERAPNTRRVLETAELVRQARPDAFAALDRAIFDAYWVEGRDIGDPSVLDDLVAGAGADAAEIRQAVEAGLVREALAASMTAAVERGVTGTPAWLVDGRMLIPGVQPRELFERVVARLSERPRPSDG